MNEERSKMNDSKNKIKIIDLKFVITSLLCLAPMVFGIIISDRLPESIPTHFDIEGNPNSFGSRTFVVYVYPCICLALNVFLNLVFNFSCRAKGERLKLAEVLKW